MNNNPASLALNDTPPPASLKRTFVVSTLIAGLLSIASAWVFLQLPDNARIPMHWNFHGQVDGYGSRAAVFFMPGVVLAVSLLLFLLPWLEPRRGNLLRSASAYRWVWLGIVTFLSGLHALMLATALGHHVVLHQWVISGFGLLLMVMGNFLGKVRSNFVFGVRTPWTLSSDLAWNRTHRLAGWSFVACGLIVAICAWLMPDRAFVVVVAAIVVASLVPTIFSYFVWRNDPQRRARSDSNHPAV